MITVLFFAYDLGLTLSLTANLSVIYKKVIIIITQIRLYNDGGIYLEHAGGQFRTYYILILSVVELSVSFYRCLTFYFHSMASMSSSLFIICTASLCPTTGGI